MSLLTFKREQNALESPVSHSGSTHLDGIYADLVAERQAIQKMLAVSDANNRHLIEANQRLHQSLQAVIRQLRHYESKYGLACDVLDIMAAVCKDQGVKLARRIIELEATSLTLADQYDLNLAAHIDDIADIHDRLKAEGRLKKQPIKVPVATMQY